MSVEGQELIATPGTFSFVPPGTTHTYSNPNPAPAKVFKIISPGGFEDFLRRVRTASNDAIKPIGRSANA